MSVTVNTTNGNSVSVTVNNGASISYTSTSSSISVTDSSPTAISVTEKGPKGDTGADGIQGPQGPAGQDGADGADGQGVPTGGVEGQVLVKSSATDYDTAWDYVEATYLQIENAETTAISAGTVVYAFGVSGSNITVKKADASNSSTMPVIGVVLEEIASGSTGEIITSGLFNKTISGLSGINVGDTVYVSETAGGVTTTKPTGTALIQNIGVVLKTNGSNIQKMKVSAIDRVNDIPNIPNGQAWIGNASGVPTPTTLSTVATSGAYSDITGTPSLAAVATSGAYSDLTGTPSLATVATSGAYSDLTGTPSLATVATSGSYNDLSDKPTIPTGDVVDDTTPQLGGDLDVNGNKIVSASNGDIVIDPHGTGAIILKSDDVRLEGTDTSVEVGTVKLYEADVLGDNFVALKAPISIASDITFTLPDSDGSDGQVLKTNGSGTLSFTDALDGVNDTLTGVTQIKDAGGTRGTVSFYDDAGDNYVALRGATTLTSDTVFILPTGDGSADHYLKTDGSGNLSFDNPTAKFRQVHSMSFIDDIVTTKHYLPWKDINEQTTIYQEEAAMLMPYDGRIVSVTVRTATISGSGNLTIDVSTAPIGNNIFVPGSFTQEETEVLAVTSTDDHHGFHFVFDNAQHFEAGDLCSIGIQASADLSSTTYWYVTTIVEFDTATDLGSSSTEHESNP